MTEQPTHLAIEIRNLTKSYGSFKALRQIDLEVNQGEIFGFLGPNGAGKTTTIRCMLDMIRPNSGTIRILGIDPQADPVAVRRKVGYLPGELKLDDNLTARQALRLFDAMRGRTSDWDYVVSVADRLQLDLNRTIKHFSKGNKQKVGVVQAVMHQPELLLLDEPTSGLDPLIQQEVIGLVKEANQRGATVFFSSHILSEVETACHRVGIVRRGKVVEIIETQDLTSRSFRYVTVRLRDGTDGHQLDSVAGVKVLDRETQGQIRLQVEGNIEPLIKALAELSVDDIEIERPSLEQIFLTYYEGDGQAPATNVDGSKT